MHPPRFISFKSSVIFDRGLSEMENKNTSSVALPEVDFSFNEDYHKVKEMTAHGFP